MKKVKLEKSTNRNRFTKWSGFIETLRTCREEIVLSFSRINLIESCVKRLAM
ncbi:MAG: hypothetical protein JJW01_02735 [Alphaproteobacteria bacterium]|nr:hypothetical protein [Rickettsiales bacterium]